MERKLYHESYKRHSSMDGITCFYCGENWQCIDHCPPISLYKYFPSHEKLKIKSCNECNLLLSAKPLPTLLSRIEYLIKKYKKRYNKFLKYPKWEDEEIEELKGSLKKYVKDTEYLRKHALRKIKYVQLTYEILLEIS